jgi:hypothetical protein
MTMRAKAIGFNLMTVRGPFLIGLLACAVAWALAPAPDCRAESPAKANGAERGRALSRDADGLVSTGHELEAVRLYLEAHQQFQDVLLNYAMSALRSGFMGRNDDEHALVEDGGRIAEWRNVNLSKLWILWDPDDRAHASGLEAERAAVLARFGEFRSPDSAGALEDFLHRLYPEDRSGDRQMEALRNGQLPPSKRWGRLQQASEPR